MNITKTKKIVIAVVATLAVISLILFFSLKYNNSEESSTNKPDDKTTSQTKTAQEDFSDGEQREPGNGLAENEGSAEIIDNNGVIDPSVNKSNPVTSSTGEISIYTPSSNSELVSGTTLTGKSSLNKISYRLIDSVSGMIATGELNVIEGHFSGKINYSTSASEGRLDVFATRQDFSEYSNVEIPVRFR